MAVRWARGSGLQVDCSCFLLQFHYENTRAQFFVEDASTASALKAVNYKILDQENRRVCIKGLPGGGDWYSLRTGSLSWNLGFPRVHPSFMSSLQISIIINSSPPPLTVQNELKPEQVEQLKVRQLHVTHVSSPVLAALRSPCPSSQIHNPSNHLAFLFLCS